MVDSTVVGPNGANVPILFSFPFQNGQIHVAIRQEHVSFSSAHLMHFESFFVEISYLAWILGCQSDMPYLVTHESSMWNNNGWCTSGWSRDVLAQRERSSIGFAPFVIAIF